MDTDEKVDLVAGGKMLNYLRVTKKRVGLILNFEHARLEWERLVL